ncbi:uncharacterized protein [Procambarus clarkii]|uniref:uncharacterized protein n=1 Tax=Procambarus clarkii TaxID=6728 RepID=UPI00374463A9
MVASWGAVALVALVLLATAGGVPAPARPAGLEDHLDVGYVEINMTVPEHDYYYAGETEAGDQVREMLQGGPSTLGSWRTLAEGKDNLIGEFLLAAATGWHDSMRSVIRSHSRARTARHLPSTLQGDAKGYWRLSGLSEDVDMKLKTFAPPSGAISMVVVEHAGLVFWLVTQAFTLHDPGTLHLYMLNVETEKLESVSVPALGANKCSPVVMEATFMEVVCVEVLADRFPDTKRMGSSVYRVTWATGLQMGFKRSLLTHGAQDMALWKVGRDTLMAFANSYNHLTATGEIDSYVYKVKVTAVSRSEVYCSYDRLDSASFPTKNAMGVEAFTIQSRHFLAVANHHDDRGNVDIDSEIFVFDEDRLQLRSVQRIRTRGARDWTAFSFSSGSDAEYFIAVANEYTLDNDGNLDYVVDSVIYRYEREKFVPFQCIQTYGAQEWVAYQGPDGEFLLAVVNSRAGVAFYQYNGWTFTRTDFHVSGAGAKMVSVARLPTTLKEVVLTVTNPSDPTNRPLVLYTRWQYHNPLAVYQREALKWCRNLQERVEGDHLPRVLAEAGKCTQTEATYSFQRAVVITGDLFVNSRGYISRVDPILVDSDGILVTDAISVTIAGMYDTSASVQRLQAAARLRLSTSMKIQQPNLDGLKFSTVRVVCAGGGRLGRCSVTNLLSQKINGVNTSLTNAVKLVENNGVLNMTLADVALTGQGVVTLLSGPGLAPTHTSQLVTLHNAHNIVGEKTFGFIRTASVLVAGTVDGVAVKADTVLLTVGEQQVKATVTMQALDAPFINLHLLNGVSFSNFYNDLVLNDVSQNWTGLVTIAGNLVASTLVSTKPLSPLDPETVKHAALLHTTTTPQTVTSSHTLGGLQIGRELTVGGRVNGARIPKDLYLMTGAPEVINTPATFVSVAANSILINNNLNHIKVVNGTLMVLLVRGEQVVSSTKVFADLTLQQHSTVRLQVAGYNLSDFAFNFQQEVILGLNAGKKVDGSLTFHDSLFVEDDHLNGASVGRIRNSGLLLNASYINMPLVFLGPVQLSGDLMVENTLNGIGVNDYVLTHANYTFTHAISFKNGLKVEGDVTTLKLDPYDVKLLASQIVLKNRINQTIMQDIHIMQAVMTDVMVPGSVSVSGVALYDLVTLTGTTEITGQKTFTNLKVLTETQMGAVNVGLTGTVDGVVFHELFVTDSLKTSASGLQTLTGRYIHALAAVSATGTDLGIFERTVVYTDSTEYIAGSLLFNGDVSVQALTFGRDFDGVSVEDYSSGWLLKDGAQTLTGSNTLQDVRAAAVSFDGIYFQTVDWNRLLQKTAKVDEATTITRASFDLITAREIVLDGAIQGWDLGVDALTTSAKAQMITGKKVFLSMVFYSGKFEMAKGMMVQATRYDSPVHVDLSTLLDSIVMKDSVVHIDKLIVQGNVNFDKDVRISGNLNDEEVKTLREKFWLSDLPANITAVASFHHVVLGPKVDLQLKGLMNGVDLQILWDTVLRKECEGWQEVSGSFTFDTLNVANLVAFRVDSADDWLSRELHNLLLVDGDQIITGQVTTPQLTAQASLRLNGTVNGLRMDRDFVLVNSRAVISGWKLFQKDVSVTGNLNVLPSALVQAMDVSQFSKTILVKSNLTVIPGVTTFKGVRILQKLVVGGTVDGVRVSGTRLLTKGGQQTMQGTLTLLASPPSTFALVVKGPLTIQDNHFNDINLDRLGSMTVLREGSVVIRSTVVFLEVVTVTEVLLVNHIVNGYNITDLALCLLGQHAVQNMGNKLALVLQAVEEVKDVLAERREDVWYYKEQQFSTRLYKLLPIQLTGDLEMHSQTTLVGLDRAGDRLLFYNITNLAQLFPAVAVVKPTAAAGLGWGLVAVCGLHGMDAAPPGTLLTSTYTKINVERGAGYGHVYRLEGGQLRLEAAFQTSRCRDLVAFRAGRQTCLAVLDYATNSSVICKLPGASFSVVNSLATTRAVKGAWLALSSGTFLLVVEAGTPSQPAHIKVYQFDTVSGSLGVIQSLNRSGMTSVAALGRGAQGLLCLTEAQSALGPGRVVILEAKPTATSLALSLLQTVVVEGAVDSSLGLMPTGDVALYVQTQYNLLFYLLKGTTFVFHREIRTTPALHPFSFPFLHEATNRAMVAYTGAGLLDVYDDLPTLQLAKPTLYTTIYKPRSTSA